MGFKIKHVFRGPAKVIREVSRISDKALDIGNKGAEKIGLDKVVGGSGRIGVNGSTGSSGGVSVSYQPNHRSAPVGVGVSNEGVPSAFLNGRVVAPLIPPPSFLLPEQNSLASASTSSEHAVKRSTEVMPGGTVNEQLPQVEPVIYDREIKSEERHSNNPVIYNLKKTFITTIEFICFPAHGYSFLGLQQASAATNDRINGRTTDSVANGLSPYVSLGEKVLDVVIPQAHADSPSSSSNSRNPELDVSLSDAMLIATGRSFVKLGQGIKQTGLEVGEKLGITEKGKVAAYTHEIAKEKSLYKETAVAQSTVGQVTEVVADIGLAVSVPGGAGATGTRFIAGSAASGAFLGGIQATEGGSLGTRAQNAAVGAAEGAIGGYVFGKTAQGLHWAWQEGKVQHGLHTFESKVDVTHTFSKAKGGQNPKHGHVLDTSENRRIITETFSDKKNFVGADKWGKEYYAKLFPDGKEAWAYTQNGKVKGAGINDAPLHHNSHGCLQKKYFEEPLRGPKQ